MKALVYTRLSASRLGEDAPGLARQRETCERLVRERGWELVDGLHDADVSAWSGVPRPGFADLRTRVEAGEAAAVVVWKLDRAFRSLSEAVEFLTLCRQHGVAFISATEGIDTTSTFGPVLFALFAAMAEIESTTRSERISAWHLQRARAGKPSGGGDRPYGFKEDRVSHEPTEARKLREAAARLVRGSSSLRTEARRLGLTTTGLRRALTRPRVVGLRQHGEDTYPAQWKPILNEETWLALRELLDRPGNGAGRRYLLTGGLAVCGLCGANLVARPKASGQRSYTCTSCGKIRRLAAPVEELVARKVSHRHDELALTTEARPKRDTTDALRAELVADEAALEDLARARYVHRSLSEREFRAARDDLVARIATTQTTLANRATGRRKYLLNLDEVETAPWELPPGTDPDPEELNEWRRWVAEVVEKVVVKAAVRGLNRFDPSCVEIRWRDGVVRKRKVS